MDLDSVSNELYAAKREEFTALRDERAKQARPDRPLVDKIAGLRKPTVAAWLVNQVSRACPEEIDRLATVGEALRDAHQRLAGGELRALSRQRHEVIDLLTQRAHWLARKASYTFGDATERQVADTFEAALGDVQALAAIRAARLSAALAPGSPETWLAGALIPAATERREGGGSAPAKERPTRTRQKDAAAEPARRDAVKVRPEANGAAKRSRGKDAQRSRREEDEAAQRARQEAAEEEAADQARQEAEAAADQAQREAEEAAGQARREAEVAADLARREAEEAADLARREAEEAAQAQDSAEQALAEAEEALAGAEQAAEDAATTVRDLQARLEDARTADREARAKATAARKTVTAARRTAKTATQRATQADERATEAEGRAAELE